MRLWLSQHAIQRAKERFSWSLHQTKQYYYRHVSPDRYNNGPGVYSMVAGGVNFVVAYDPDNREIRIMSLVLANGYNETGYLGPLTDSDGQRIDYYRPVPKTTVPTVVVEQPMRQHRGPNKHGIPRHCGGT